MQFNVEFPRQVIFNFYVSLFLQDKNYIFLNNRNLKNVEVCEPKPIGFKKSSVLPTLRDGPLENLWGGGGWAKYKKNIRARQN